MFDRNVFVDTAINKISKLKKILLIMTKIKEDDYQVRLIDFKAGVFDDVGVAFEYIRVHRKAYIGIASSWSILQP